MSPEQIARNTYPEDKSTRWWVYYPSAAYSCNIDFWNPVGVEEVIKRCLSWTSLDHLEEGTEIYI